MNKKNYKHNKENVLIRNRTQVLSDHCSLGLETYCTSLMFFFKKIQQ